MDEAGSKKRSIDERLDALTMNLELTSHANEAQDRRIEKLTASIEKLVDVSNRDAVDISALARIAEAHEHRLENLDGGRG
jgi:acetolactate synthase regulatory subunit